MTGKDLSDAILINFNVVVDSKYSNQIIQMLTQDEKIASVVKLNEGFGFCTTERLILFYENQRMVIPFSTIQDVKLSKGVAFTVEDSELTIVYNNQKVMVKSSENRKLEAFMGVILEKLSSNINVSTSVSEKNPISAIIKTIFGLVLLYWILKFFGIA